MQYKRVFIMTVIIMATFILTGCYIFEPITRPATAKRELKEKYGESFVVHRFWDYSGGFKALCSPSDSEDICFEAILSDDGEYMRDEYVQEIVSSQLQEKVTPIIQRISANCWIEPIVFYDETSFTNADDVTIESYLEQVETPECLMCIYIDKDELQNLTVEEEFEIFEQIIPNEIALLDVISIYFMDSDDIKRAEEYFESNRHITTQLHMITGRESDIGLVYKEGHITNAYEDYYNKRLKEE